MSQKEVKRAQVLDLLREDKISQPEASKQMGVSTRQVRRLAKHYQTGLVSKKRGRASNRRLDAIIRATAIERHTLPELRSDAGYRKTRRAA